jgi:hypothetical protein
MFEGIEDVANQLDIAARLGSLSPVSRGLVRLAARPVIVFADKGGES